MMPTSNVTNYLPEVVQGPVLPTKHVNAANVGIYKVMQPLFLWPVEPVRTIFLLYCLEHL